MKRTLLIITLAVGFLDFQCKKEQINPAKSDITGKWLWIKSCGGFAGGCQTPESTGKKIVIEFTKDSSFRMYENDVLTQETSYVMRKGKSILSRDSVSLIERKNMIRVSFSFTTSDTLLLNEECYDCFGSKYTRIK